MPAPHTITRIVRRRRRKVATKAQPAVDLPTVTSPSPPENSQELKSTKKAGRNLSRLLKRKPRRQASPSLNQVAAISPLPDNTPDDPVTEPLADSSPIESSVCVESVAAALTGAGAAFLSVVSTDSPDSPSFAEAQVVPPPTPATPTALQQTPSPRTSVPASDSSLAGHVVAADDDDDSSFREAVEPHTPKHASTNPANHLDLSTANGASVSHGHRRADEVSKHDSAIDPDLRHRVQDLLCTPPAAPCTANPANEMRTPPSQATPEKAAPPPSGGGASPDSVQVSRAPATVQPISPSTAGPPRSDSAPDCAVQGSPVSAHDPSTLRQDQSAPNLGSPGASPDETSTPPLADFAIGRQLKHGEKVFTIEGQLEPNVALARDEANREVAIKLLSPSILETPEVSAAITDHRIMKEAAERDEPFINKLLASWVDDQAIYIVMPYYYYSIAQVPYGVPISKPLKSPMWDYYKTTAEMIFGLARFHQMGYAHLEINPQSVVIGPTGHIAFTNFRSAQKVDAGGRVSSPPQFSIVGFEAPECYLPGLFGEITQKADIWNLGLVIAWTYARLAGAPFSARAASKINSWQVRSGVDPVVDHVRTVDAVRLAAVEMDPLQCDPFPGFISQHPDLFNMLSKMLVRDPRHRWSAEELMKHRFFHYIDWDDLARCEPLYEVERPRKATTTNKTPLPPKKPTYDFSYRCSKYLMDKGFERHYGCKPAYACS